MGWGFLKQMNDTLKYNRDLLGKRKSIRELYKEELAKRTANRETVSIEQIRIRVADRLKEIKKRETINKITSLLTLLLILIGISWVLAGLDFSTKTIEKYADKQNLFVTEIEKLPNGLELRTDFYKYGGKAAETKYKNGKKHQNSESYYQTGQQFRTALYYYDSIIVDIYLYKNGDTIKYLKTPTDLNIYRIKIPNHDGTKTIEFDFYDGKIIEGTYKEKEIIK